MLMPQRLCILALRMILRRGAHDTQEPIAVLPVLQASQEPIWRAIFRMSAMAKPTSDAGLPGSGRSRLSGLLERAAT